MFFVIVFGKKTLGLILPAFKDDRETVDIDLKIENHDSELFLGLFRRDNLKDLGKALLLTVIIIILGAGIAMLFPKEAFQSVFILSISLSPFLRASMAAY
jgi:hypothetical protein